MWQWWHAFALLSSCQSAGSRAERAAIAALFSVVSAVAFSRVDSLSVAEPPESYFFRCASVGGVTWRLVTLDEVARVCPPPLPPADMVDTDGDVERPGAIGDDLPTLGGWVGWAGRCTELVLVLVVPVEPSGCRVLGEGGPSAIVLPPPPPPPVCVLAASMVDLAYADACEDDVKVGAGEVMQPTPTAGTRTSGRADATWTSPADASQTRTNARDRKYDQHTQHAREREWGVGQPAGGGRACSSRRESVRVRSHSKPPRRTGTTDKQLTSAYVHFRHILAHLQPVFCRSFLRLGPRAMISLKPKRKKAPKSHHQPNDRSAQVAGQLKERHQYCNKGCSNVWSIKSIERLER